MDRRVTRPGDTLILELWWEALAALAADCTVFAHLLLPPDAEWAGTGRLPGAGEAPASAWRPGWQVTDSHILTLPPAAPAGAYVVEVGRCEPVVMRRPAANLDESGIVPGRVRVEARAAE